MTTQQILLNTWIKISSKLSLEDLETCRSVSRLIKSSTHRSLEGVTNLHVRKEYDCDEDEAGSSYIYNRFLSKPFVGVTVKGGLGDSFFSFIGKYCPNLQVLDARDP